MPADLLRWPIAGAWLRRPGTRTAAQLFLLLVAILIVIHGFFGAPLAALNLATVLTWIHYRGLLIGALLIAGNAFCGTCPMILVRDVGRRFHQPVRRWPRWLGGKTIALILFAGILFSYELFDLWAWPAATAALVIGYFAAALIVDLTFSGAAFCKHVCPVGQFNFIASTLSPLEVHVREPAVCRSCKTVDCIKGRRDEAVPAVVIRRGCELSLFQPTKVGNLDCTFCLDCVHACPHDNVGIGFRVPGEELTGDRRRSSLGRLTRRPDLAALALLFTFGALLNAFAMIGPVYTLEHWIAGALGTSSEAPVLAIVFVSALIVIPFLLCGGAAWTTKQLAAARSLTVGDLTVRYAYALVPFGFGVWLAHYGFHFLTGVGTIVPVTQSAAIEAAGRAVLGEPNWSWLGLRPSTVFPLQLGTTVLGAIGSILLVHRISERDHPAATTRASASWMVLVALLTLLALWILAQPMEMRGTELSG
jgi:ferredoxin